MRAGKRQGFVALVALIFLAVFCALGVAFSGLATTNVQIAHNHHLGNGALAAASSGGEVVRYWLSQAPISSAVAPEDRLSTLAAGVQQQLAAHDVTNVAVQYTGSALNFSGTLLDGASFTAVMVQPDSDSTSLDTTGVYRGIRRTVRTGFRYAVAPNPIFAYGVASQGPISMVGNARILGLSNPGEGCVFIKSPDDNSAFSMTGNDTVSGEVSIVNPNASVTLTGNISIGGATGPLESRHHVHTGVPDLALPVTEAGVFRPYATTIVDGTTKTTGNTTFTNILIRRGTNPSFTGNCHIYGVVFIEQPNIVTFSGNLTIEGMIATDGNVEAPSSANQIKFTGNTTITAPTDRDKYGDLVDKTGTFLLAPGFSATFTGNVGTVHGTIACSGLKMTGNSGGTVRGSIINYANDPMSMTGNDHWTFDHSGLSPLPAGFSGEMILQYNAGAYDEIATP